MQKKTLPRDSATPARAASLPRRNRSTFPLIFSSAPGCFAQAKSSVSPTGGESRALSGTKEMSSIQGALLPPSDTRSRSHSAPRPLSAQKADSNRCCLMVRISCSTSEIESMLWSCVKFCWRSPLGIVRTGRGYTFRPSTDSTRFCLRSSSKETTLRSSTPASLPSPIGARPSDGSLEPSSWVSCVKMCTLPNVVRRARFTAGSSARLHFSPSAAVCSTASAMRLEAGRGAGGGIIVVVRVVLCNPIARQICARPLPCQKRRADFFRRRRQKRNARQSSTIPPVLCTRSLYISSHTWPNFLFWRQSRRGAMAAEAAESAEMQLVFAPSFSDADYKLVELDEDALQELLNDNGRRVAHIPVARPTLPKLLLLMSPAAACLSIQGPPVKPPLTDVAPTLLAASLSRARSKTRRYFAPPSAATGFAGRIPLTLSCSPPVRSRWANLGAVKTVSPLSMERILPQR